MKIFDTHCHLQFSQYDSDREEVIKRALDADMGMTCVGTDYETSRKAVELAERYDNIWASVGLHPNDIEQMPHVNCQMFEVLLASPKVVAVGEVGLDYYRTPEPEKQKLKREQREVLCQFSDIASHHNKPLIIHCRNGSAGLATSTHEDMVEILSQRANSKGQVLSGVIHSFTGTWLQAQKYLELGFYIGLNGIITFTVQHNESVIKIPLEKILLETDAPFLAPASHRGERNEPVFVSEVARKVGDLKGINIEKVLAQTTHNAKTLFGR